MFGFGDQLARRAGEHMLGAGDADRDVAVRATRRSRAVSGKWKPHRAVGRPAAATSPRCRSAIAEPITSPSHTASTRTGCSGVAHVDDPAAGMEPVQRRRKSRDRAAPAAAHTGCRPGSAQSAATRTSTSTGRSSRNEGGNGITKPERPSLRPSAATSSRIRSATALRRPCAPSSQSAADAAGPRPWPPTQPRTAQGSAASTPAANDRTRPPAPRSVCGSSTVADQRRDHRSRLASGRQTVERDARSR